MAHEKLISMISNLINEKSEEASLDFHQYITEQVKAIVGLTEGEKNNALNMLLDPKINWWEQIDDVKRAYKSKEINEDDVQKWCKKIDKDENVSSPEKFGDGVYLIPSGAKYFVEDKDSDWISNYLAAHIVDDNNFDELEDFAKKHGSKGITIISAYNGGSSSRNEIAFIGCKPADIKVLSKGLQQHYTEKDFDENLADEDDGDATNITVFADDHFGGLEKFMKDYGVSKNAALSFLNIEAPNIVNVLETSKGILMAIAEND